MHCTVLYTDFTSILILHTCSYEYIKFLITVVPDNTRAKFNHLPFVNHTRSGALSLYGAGGEGDLEEEPAGCRCCSSFERLWLSACAPLESSECPLETLEEEEQLAERERSRCRFCALWCCSSLACRSPAASPSSPPSPSRVHRFSFLLRQRFKYV